MSATSSGTPLCSKSSRLMRSSGAARGDALLRPRTANWSLPTSPVRTSMIVNRQRRVPVAVKPLKRFYERVRQELQFPPESVTVQLISDDAMARLNRTFRSKHGPTDVLSFPAKPTRPTENAKYVGDIAIS